MKPDSNLTGLNEKIQNDFKINQQIMSFDGYLSLIKKTGTAQLRGSAQYAADMMNFFGKDGDQFRLFHIPLDGITPKIVGQQKVQEQIYRSFKAFARQGLNNRLVLLHGPNGSAKSSLVASLMQGLELYSKTPEGAMYTFSWIFPMDRVVRGSLGIRGDQDKKSAPDSSYALLTDEEIACIIPSDLRDHPLLLIPTEHRQKFLESFDHQLDRKSSDRLAARLHVGGLSHRDHQIFTALLNNYQGDYAQVLRHIRVERLYLSRVYRNGLVTVEPQMHVDAQSQQLTLNRSLSSIPSALQGLNLFSIHGDLPDANRGMIDFADLLKRPIDSYKYLLGACESGKVNIGATIAHLDCIFIGSSNELQLDAFKEYADFSSFKGRIELIRVPYLIRLSEEMEVYTQLLPSLAGEKTITPHTDWAIAFWGILTRLKKPQRERFPTEISTIIDKLTPLDKLRFYDQGEVPERFSNEERKLLKANAQLIRDEYLNVPYYEGRSGASARELKSILIDAAQNPDFKTLSPLAVASELKKFVKRTSEYEFLRQDSVDGYHHHESFIETMLNEYAVLVDREIRECLGLYDTRQWGDFMKRYIIHLSSLLKKEKMKNPITGAYDEPDTALLNEFEGIVDAPKDSSQRDQFRQNLITQIGAWVLDHPKEPIDYFRVFPELKQRIEKHFYESQKALLQKMNSSLKMFGTDHEDRNSEGSQLARQTIQNMQKKFGYTDEGAKEVIGFLMTKRY